MVAFMGHFTGEDIAQQVHACIGCQECLLACPTIDQPIAINHLNSQTLTGPITSPVARFARACTQCGACASVCPVGLHREAMMLWLKVRLLRVAQAQKGIQAQERIQAQKGIQVQERIRIQERIRVQERVPALQEESIGKYRKRQFMTPLNF